MRVCVCVSLHCGRVDVLPDAGLKGFGCLLLLGFLQGNAGLLLLLLLLLKLLLSLGCDLGKKNKIMKELLSISDQRMPSYNNNHFKPFVVLFFKMNMAALKSQMCIQRCWQLNGFY